MTNVFPLRKDHEQDFVRRFGRAVRDARKLRGLSHEALARRNHQSSATQSLVEAGKLVKLPIYTAWCISEGLEVPLDTLCAEVQGSTLDLSAYRVRLLLHAYTRLRAPAQELLVSTALELERVQQPVEA